MASGIVLRHLEISARALSEAFAVAHADLRDAVLCQQIASAEVATAKAIESAIDRTSGSQVKP